jgi:hypothetical protein
MLMLITLQRGQTKPMRTIKGRAYRLLRCEYFKYTQEWRVLQGKKGTFWQERGTFSKPGRTLSMYTWSIISRMHRIHLPLTKRNTLNIVEYS